MTKSDASATPPSDKRTLTEISPFAWEHPTDRAALNALQQIPGFDTLLKKTVGAFGERNISMSYKAQAIRVGPNQYADIHKLLEGVCETLDTNVPPLYISQQPIANAGAYGMDNPFIVLNSSLIELASDPEITAVLGHEVGHIMSEHALYRTLLALLIGYAGPMSPLVSQAVVPITMALQEWSRKAEVSCDRAGLLAVQDLDASIGLLCVMAGGVRGRSVNIDAFVEQSDEYGTSEGLDAYYKFMATLGRSHPFPVVRVAELRQWVASGAYDEILDGTYHRQGEPRPLAEDVAEAGKTFSDSAQKVFEDTDRYVNRALMGFIDGAKRRLSDDDANV